MSSQEGDTELETSRDVLTFKEPRGRRVPLNSKRLTVAHLRQLGKSWGLLAGRLGDETRQLVEEKIAERDDPFVQVYSKEEPLM